jgi:hypothetical protein
LRFAFAFSDYSGPAEKTRRCDSETRKKCKRRRDPCSGSTIC